MSRVKSSRVGSKHVSTLNNYKRELICMNEAEKFGRERERRKEKRLIRIDFCEDDLYSIVSQIKTMVLMRCPREFTRRDPV